MPTATKSHLCTATQKMLTTPSLLLSAPSAFISPTPFPATTLTSSNATSKLSGVYPTPCSHLSRTTSPPAITFTSTKQQPLPATPSFQPKVTPIHPMNSFVAQKCASFLYPSGLLPSSFSTLTNAKQTPDSTIPPQQPNPKPNSAFA